MVLRDKLGIVGLLHDAIEDAKQNGYDPEMIAEEIKAKFGSYILGIVKELSQDMSLPTPERRAAMIDHCGSMSLHAMIVKLADRLDNVREMKGMSKKFIARYLDETPRMLAKMKGACPALEREIWDVINPYLLEQNSSRDTIIQKKDGS